jgi:hypothetical protein
MSSARLSALRGYRRYPACFSNNKATTANALLVFDLPFTCLYNCHFAFIIWPISGVLHTLRRPEATYLQSVREFAPNAVWHTYTGTYNFNSLSCSSVRTSLISRLNCAVVMLRHCVKGQRLSDSRRSPIITTASLPILALTGSVDYVITVSHDLAPSIWKELEDMDRLRRWDRTYLDPSHRQATARSQLAHLPTSPR